MTPSRTVIVVGLDGVPPRLIDAGIDANRLPTFERLRHDGVEGTTQSTVPPVSMMAWSTFATGCSPGTHGIYNFILKEPSGYGTRFVTAADLRASAIPFWEYLDAVDVSSGVMNVMPSYPPSETRGFHISDMITTPIDAEYAYPREIKTEIEAIAPAFELASPTGYQPGEGAQRLTAYLEYFFAVERARMTAVKHLIETHRCPALIFVFSAPDVLLHEIGHLLDPEHPEHDPALADTGEGAVWSLLERYDAFLGWTIRQLDDEDVLLVLSDHGHGSIHTAINLNSWLYQNGYLALRARPTTMAKRIAYNHFFQPVQAGMKRLNVYHQIKRALARTSGAGNRADLADFLAFSPRDIEWSRTTAFTVAGDGQVYLNTTDDHEKGTVPPGAYEETREALRERLLSIRDPDTGEPVIAEVVDGEAAYPGKHDQARPDLVCVPAPGYRITFPQTMRTNQPFVPPQKYAGHTSNRERDGIFYAFGDTSAHDKPIELALTDFAPTILELLGVAAPDQMDGVARTELFQTLPAEQTVVKPDQVAVQRSVRSVARRVRSTGDSPNRQ